ncbi:CdaR family protein [Flavobacteriaceae bacterium M23B6Z8]
MIIGMLKRRKLSVFAIFFVFTSILWLLVKLSETYNATINYDIEYVSVPKDKLILGNPVTNLNISVRAGGYTILKHRIFQKSLKLDVSRVEAKEGKYIFSTSYLEAAVKEQLNKDIILQSIQRGFIPIELGKNSEKRVPVFSNVEISFERDFDLYGELRLNPDSITVRGSENLVDTLMALETKAMKLADVNSDIEVTVSLALPEALQQLDFSTKSIQITGSVIRFTEKIVEVPLIINNKPDKITIRLFPEKIKVKCRGSLADIKKVLSNDILVTADFNEIENTGVLIPKIKKYPEYLRSAEILDKKVEFLIKKE